MAPLESSTTTQTIAQVQISSCTSHCQNGSQVQVAEQESVTVQIVGTAAQSAVALEMQPSPASASQITSGVTQIQIGCISECFGTTTIDPSTAALTQQFLSDLGSLQPTCGSSSVPPIPATVEGAIDELACQVQVAQSMAAQTQVASQDATTVHVTDAAPVSQPQAPQSVAQAQQGTWQLQIGCVFYCVNTQQVQQAQQSITIIHVQTGTPGSSPGEVDVTDQIIWQVQVGCVAWCYDATQVQIIAGQSTVIVDESPAPASPPPVQPPPDSPPPPPAPNPPTPVAQTGPVAGPSTGTPSASPPAAGPPMATSSTTRRVGLFKSVASAGASVSIFTGAVTPVPRVPEATVVAVSSRPGVAPTVRAERSASAIWHLYARRSRHPAARPHTDHPVRVAQALEADPRAPSDVPDIALALAAAAALLALAVVWTQTADKSAR